MRADSYQVTFLGKTSRALRAEFCDCAVTVGPGTARRVSARVYPVLGGDGIPFFPQRERRVDLELVETRTVSSRVVYLRYRVAR